METVQDTDVTLEEISPDTMLVLASLIELTSYRKANRWWAGIFVFCILMIAVELALFQGGWLLSMLFVSVLVCAVSSLWLNKTSDRIKQKHTCLCDMLVEDPDLHGLFEELAKGTCAVAYEAQMFQAMLDQN